MELALKHNEYLEIVMGYRQRYLDKLGRKETEKVFLSHQGEVRVTDHIRQQKLKN